MRELSWPANIEAADVASRASLAFSVLMAIAASAAFVSLVTRGGRHALAHRYVSPTVRH